jgi:hypothetical protein
VGAPGEPTGGAVYVFQRGADGKWTASGALPAQDSAAGDRFGASIAIDGNRIAVGAPARKSKGAVFIFRKDAAGVWTQESEQAAPTNLPDNAQLGAAVAVKGDRVIAGAPGTNFNPPPANPTRDSLLARLAASTAGPARDSIAASLATALSGAGGRGNFGGGGRGGAQLGLASGMVIAYQRASFNSWRVVGTLAPFDFGNINFGAALATVGDELWIGAPAAMARVASTARAPTRMAAGPA